VDADEKKKENKRSNISIPSRKRLATWKVIYPHLITVLVHLKI